MVRLRFNLGRGENFRKWQVKEYKDSKVSSVDHYDPSNITILLQVAKLNNRKSVAHEIFEGKNKTVCAWVTAEYYYLEVGDSWPDYLTPKEEEKISYNPRVAPHWADAEGNDIDGKAVKWVLTKGTDLYDITAQMNARIEEQTREILTED